MTHESKHTPEKIAPVQGYSAGIPWSMHLRAYDAYCKRYGPQQALIDLEGRNCRGGFGVGELDMFIPGWRDELSEIKKLAADLSREREKVAALVEALRPFANIALEQDGDKRRDDMISGPDLSITPKQVRAARSALDALAKAEG